MNLKTTQHNSAANSFENPFFKTTKKSAPLPIATKIAAAVCFTFVL